VLWLIVSTSKEELLGLPLFSHLKMSSIAVIRNIIISKLQPIPELATAATT
jgi:hypothetical protein